VPVVVDPQPAVTPPPSRSYEASAPATITPPLNNPKCGGNSPDSWANAPWYLYSNVQELTINPVAVNSTPRETYVNIVVNGNIMMYGTVVCKSFYANGDCYFHYDTSLANLMPPKDYRIASYVEDIR